MKKRTVFSLASIAVLFASISCQPSSKKYLESEAIATLDSTTAAIGKLHSCSLRVTTERTDIKEGQPVTSYRKSDVYLRGNNNMHMYSSIDDARKAFWYNGHKLAVYRFDAQEYDILQAPPTTMAMIDSLHSVYHIDFPGADIFYPTLTDDVIANFDSVTYLPMQTINGQNWVGVNAINDSLDVSLFLDEATFLPTQLIIMGRGQRQGESYFSNYQDWQLNPVLGDEIFEFSPPKNAKRVEFLTKPIAQ